MQQIVQKLKTGQMRVVQVPIPSLQKGCILVKNHYSIISAGTEGSTVKTARKGYIGKAKERPQQVKQIVDVLRSQGPVQTYRAVMKKLDSYSSLGYSCSGEVVAVAPDINGYSIGDLIACSGLTASHAEVVNVPANLCVKLQPDANMKNSAYSTLGAIALQGIRQANVRPGETCAVIGLGLLGQLTGLLLKAGGIDTVGIDIDPSMVEIAAKHNSLDFALNRKEDGIVDRNLTYTKGIGCDAIIITAASDSVDPVNFAGAISRKKATIVIVGAVPTGFDREPHFYKKELQVKMSCSYGPGRYDPAYEEKGLDYPVAYVRWTENRNMQAFQNLLYQGKIDVGYLTTHTFKLEDVPKAYDMILSKSEPFIGILIEYDISKQIDHPKVFIKPPASNLQPSPVSIGFIGAGSYAQSHLLPNIPKRNDVVRVGVLTTTGNGSRSAAERYEFGFCTTNGKDIIENDDINTVFIATRHNSHAGYVISALKAGKHVFTEKPLCLNEDELGQIVDLFISKDPKESLSENTNQPILMVCYNRRFSPLITEIKNKVNDGPIAVVYRVNAGAIPKDSWIQDPEMGGGRIIGEVCHFVDTLTFLTGSLPISVYATAMTDPNNLNDTLNVTLTYKNGSIGAISYLANGDKSLPKERIEVFAHGTTAIVNDFRELTIYSRGKRRRKKLISQDKGQKQEVKQFIEALIEGKGLRDLIPFEEIHNTSLVTFKITESIRSGASVKLDLLSSD